MIVESDALYKFASEIGFREGKRRKRLAALLEAFKHPPKERHKIYRKILNTPPILHLFIEKKK